MIDFGAGRWAWLDGAIGFAVVAPALALGWLGGVFKK